MEKANKIMAERDFSPGSVLRHFKGSKYIIIGLVANCSNNSNNEIYVNYRGLNAPFGNYIRDVEEFCSKVDKNKYQDVEQEYRFEKVEQRKVFV